MSGDRLSRRGVVAAGLVLAARPVWATQRRSVQGFLEPHMHLVGLDPAGPRVALTFDACGGQVDPRIFDTLLAEEVAATIFVAGPWLAHNRASFDRLLARPDLFEIGNHGLHHHAAIDRPVRLWGVPSAGSATGIADEVEGGAARIIAAGGPRPRWFRGATALYTVRAMAEIAGLGYRVAGFSVNGDDGASLPARRVAANYARAADGAVLISHINQPHRSAGAGVVAGIRALKARGTRFVRLSQAGVVVSAAV